MLQLIDGLVHIGQCRVALVLFEGGIDLRAPAPTELFERAHIKIAVVEKRLKFGHVLHQKTAVLANGVAAQR